MPEEILATLARRRRRGREAYAAWHRRHEAAPAELRAAFDGAIAGELPADLAATVNAYKRKLSAERPAPASARPARWRWRC